MSKRPIDDGVLSATEVDTDHAATKNWDNAVSSSTTDAFLASMTFANTTTSEFPSFCEGCDECEAGSSVPHSIQAAIRRYKQQKLASLPVKRTQSRSLLRRGTAVVVWEFLLPAAADPLVEFGNPTVYRLVWIRHLPDKDSVHSIGSGVIGSSHEEKNRERMDWVKDDVIFLPPCEKAIGWAVKREDDSTPEGPATFVISKVKISDDVVETDDALLPLFDVCLNLRGEQNPTKLSADTSADIKKIIRAIVPK